MSPIKAFGVVGVMIACFVVIYPRFMHPFVLRALGMYEPPKKDADETMYPPHYRSMHPGGHKPQGVQDEAKKNMRSPPHPGMRAAAEMQRQQSQQGSGRGMMGVVLPMYAIGIVLYLIYTLFKVFNKSKGTSWNEGSPYDNRLERDYPLDRMGLPADSDSVGDVRRFFTDDHQRKELENLLTRVDDKNVSLDEMRILQKRLEETEAQMSRILKAMQSVQTNVDTMNIPLDGDESKINSDDQSLNIESQEVAGEEGGIDEKEDTQNDSKNNKHPKPEKQKPSNTVQEEHGKAQKLKKQVDLDGIDNDSDEDGDNGDDGREEEDVCVDEKDEEKNDADKTTVSNLRQRKGRQDNEQ